MTRYPTSPILRLYGQDYTLLDLDLEAHRALLRDGSGALYITRQEITPRGAKTFGVPERLKTSTARTLLELETD